MHGGKCEEIFCKIFVEWGQEGERVRVVNCDGDTCVRWWSLIGSWPGWPVSWWLVSRCSTDTTVLILSLITSDERDCDVREGRTKILSFKSRIFVMFSYSLMLRPSKAVFSINLVIIVNPMWWSLMRRKISWCWVVMRKIFCEVNLYLCPDNCFWWKLMMKEAYITCG